MIGFLLLDAHYNAFNNTRQRIIIQRVPSGTAIVRRISDIPQRQRSWQIPVAVIWEL
jgi:hypothetical protein